MVGMIAVVAPAAPQPVRQPLFRTVDLNRGELQEVELADGKEVKVKLLDVQEERDSLRLGDLSRNHHGRN